VGEHHERGAAGQPCHILFEPVQLVLAEAAQARRLEVQDIDEPDKMHALVIEALPAVPRSPFAVAVQKFRPPIGKDVMLAGHVKDLAALDLFEGLSEGVEGARFLAMGEVPGVEEKGRCRLERVDLGERQLQRGHHVGIRRALKANMGVANLHEGKIPARRLSCRGLRRRGLAECPGREESPGHGPDEPGPGPGHAGEDVATLDALFWGLVVGVVVLIADGVVCHDGLLDGYCTRIVPFMCGWTAQK
jgi:hypothetical protein